LQYNTQIILSYQYNSIQQYIQVGYTSHHINHHPSNCIKPTLTNFASRVLKDRIQRLKEPRAGKETFLDLVLGCYYTVRWTVVG